MTPEEADAEEEAGELEEALRLWRTLAELEKSAPYFCRVGEVAKKFERWAESEDLFLNAVRLDPDFGMAYECLGHLWFHRVDFPYEECRHRAMQWFSAALEKDRNARTLSVLGYLYNVDDEPLIAQSHLEEALRVDPNYEEAMLNLATSLVK